MKVESRDGGRRVDGTARERRIEISLGHGIYSLSEVEATELRDALTRELGAPQALTDRETLVWAAAFDRSISRGNGIDGADAAREAWRVVDVLRRTAHWDGGVLSDGERAMLAAMTGGGR